MSKKPSYLIVVLVIIYLFGLGYLALKNQASNSPSFAEPSGNQIIAPDGSVLKGPTSPPGLAPINQSPQDPLKQSTGPTMPPPQ